ncbi:MAG TPA: enoyl-CoA hydratase/isomerase family protein [Nakamurella sp.]
MQSAKTEPASMDASSTIDDPDEVDALVTVEHRSGGVVLVTLNGGKENRLSTALLGRLRLVARRLAVDPPRAVVVWGGEVVFSRGGDASEFEHYDPAVGRLVSTAFHEAFDAVATIPCPTIAAIAGAGSCGPRWRGPKQCPRNARAQSHWRSGRSTEDSNGRCPTASLENGPSSR